MLETLSCVWVERQVSGPSLEPGPALFQLKKKKKGGEGLGNWESPL